jgi:glycosyltransferase involved in cell wall biosynthesis
MQSTDANTMLPPHSELTPSPANRLPLDQGTDADLQHVHVPTPGDHYSSLCGSAAITVIYEMTRRHVERGGQTQIITGRTTHRDYTVGQCLDVDFAPLPGKKKRLIDVGMGRLGLRRPAEWALYEPAAAALPPDFRGTVFVHNAPTAIRVFKARRPHAKVCLYAHNSLFRTYSRREAQRVIDAADRVICVSRYLANDLESHLGAKSPKIRVVLNGVDTERFRPAANRIEPEVPTILFVGRVLPEKGPDLLLKAAAKLYGPQRKFKIRIVGSSGFADYLDLTPYELELRRLAQPLGDAVEFQRFVDRNRVVEEYQAASIFCAPSNWDDPCPLTVLEGLASGLPMVAAQRGGIPEEGADAILYFKPPNADELAEKLALLIDDVAVRADWGRRARARAEALSWQNQYEHLWEAVVG